VPRTPGKTLKDLLRRIKRSWRQARGLPPTPPLTPGQLDELREAYRSGRRQP
jgi:hypothetical protein